MYVAFTERFFLKDDCKMYVLDTNKISSSLVKHMIEDRAMNFPMNSLVIMDLEDDAAIIEKAKIYDNPKNITIQNFLILVY